MFSLIAAASSQPTHLVLTVDLPGANSNDMLPLVATKEAGPRGSLHSIRRGSFDVRSMGSDGLRRTSLAKLNALPLEAPITQVVTILSQIQENCSLEEARLLDRVMEVLKREGLYTAQMKEFRMDDPIASDLIGALLTVILFNYFLPAKTFCYPSMTDVVYFMCASVRSIPGKGRPGEYFVT